MGRKKKKKKWKEKERKLDQLLVSADSLGELQGGRSQIRSKNERNGHKNRNGEDPQLAVT